MYYKYALASRGDDGDFDDDNGDGDDECDGDDDVN